MKINNTGHTTKVLYDCNLCSTINGLLLLGDNLYVVNNNGTVAEIQPHTGELINVYHIPNVGYIRHAGSLSSDPSNIPHTDILLLPDFGKGEIFSYSLTSGNKQVHVTGLSNPTSVSYMFLDLSTYYIVCEGYADRVNIYNSSWGFVSSFGGYGYGDGDLFDPYSVVLSSNNSIIVSEVANERMSVFTSDGQFLHYLLEEQIESPEALSYFKPCIWVIHYVYSTDDSSKLYRHRLDY